MADQMTDGDLTEIAERHGTRIYGHHVRAEWAYYEIPALIAEVRRLRAERTAMLDALEAAQVVADLDTWSWEDRQGAVGEWDDRIARVRDLFGGAV